MTTKREELENKIEMYTNSIKKHQQSIVFLKDRLKETYLRLRKIKLEEIKKDFPFLDS